MSLIYSKLMKKYFIEVTHRHVLGMNSHLLKIVTEGRTVAQ